MGEALEPVVAALLAAADRRAAEIVSTARAERHVAIAQARRQAERIVADARAEGTRAAEHAGRSDVAAARRRAHQLVLEARGRAYEALRHNAVCAVENAADTAEARQLMRRLGAMAVAQLEGTAKPPGSPSTGAVARPHVRTHGMAMELSWGGRQVVVGPETLVDEVLESMAGEVEALWV